MGNVVTKKTQRLGDIKLEKMINTRAMIKLNDSVKEKVLLGNIPKLDDVLEEFIQDAINNTDNGGDDVADPEEAADDLEEDDEDLDVVGLADGEEELAELGENRNSDLERHLIAML